MLPAHTGAGQRHVSTSQLESSGRFAAGMSGTTHFGMPVPPPPPMPPPSVAGLPAHALNQREYQPHYAPRPDYKNNPNRPYSPLPPSSQGTSYPSHSKQANPLQTQLSYGSPGPFSHQQQHRASHYIPPRPPQNLYQHPSAQSSETSFQQRYDSPSEADFRGPQQPGSSGILRSGHAQSPSTSNTSFPITEDVAVVWTLERVVNYLDRHHIPTEWHTAFRNLNIYGVEFLELAQTQNHGLITHVLPEVMRLCPKADENKERAAAKNIKKMIRDFLKVAQTVDDSADFYSAPPLARTSGKRPVSTPRSVTMPVYSDLSPGFFGSEKTDYFTGNGEAHHRNGSSDSRTRNDFSKAALGSVDHVRHSPSNSESSFRDSTAGLGRPSLPTSPHGSPSLGYQVPQRHGHTNSTESATSMNHKPVEGKDEKALRILGVIPRGTKVAESPGHERRQDPLETQKHSGGNILNKVRQKFWPKEGGEGEGDSPTSPGKHPASANMPFISAENNGSSSSVDRASASSVEGRKHRNSTYGVANKKAKKYAFVTRDGRVWILVDITNTDSVDAIKREICLNLDIVDWGNAVIHLTEVGQEKYGNKYSTNLGQTR